MCTSSSTTSGRCSRISATASSTVPASPTTSSSSPSSARTPERNRWWSSTITTRGWRSRAAARRRLHRSASGIAAAPSPARPPCPHPGCSCTAARPSWRSMRRDDRVAHAAAIGRDRVQVEADAAIAHEHLDAVRPPPPRTDPRARCRRTSPRWSSPPAPPARPPRGLPFNGASPTVTTSIGTPCSSSTSAAARSSAPATLSSSDSPGRFNSQLRSSRSWRRARPATSRGSPARFWISASVCSTESCRCAATSARSCSRIRAARSNDEAAPQPHHPRAHDQAEHHADDRHRPDRLAEAVLDADRVQQRGGAERHEQAARDQARSADLRRAVQVVAQRRAPFRQRRVQRHRRAPQQRHPARAQHERPQPLAHVRARQVHRRANSAATVSTISGAWRHAPGRPRACAPGTRRDQRPRERVGRHAEAAHRRRHHRQHAHDQHLHAHALRQARAHAAEQRPVERPPQRRRVRLGLPCRCRSGSHRSIMPARSRARIGDCPYARALTARTPQAAGRPPHKNEAPRGPARASVLLGLQLLDLLLELRPSPPGRAASSRRPARGPRRCRAAAGA